MPLPPAAPVASLPMYDWPEVTWATDVLWEAISERLERGGIKAPVMLSRARPVEEVWRDPGLVLSQICGYPYATRLKRTVRLVGTPVYAAEGCEGPLYSSAVVKRRGEAGRRLSDLSGRVAFNAVDSLSGYVALRAWMRGRGADPAAAEWIETGSHRASLGAVASGDCDFAAVDAVCWALAGRHEPAAAALDVLAWTERRPGLPFITARTRSDAETTLIRDAITAALADPGMREVRDALLLTGLARVEATDYDAIGRLERRA